MTFQPPSGNAPPPPPQHSQVQPVYAPGVTAERAFPPGVQVASPWVRLGSCFLESLLVVVTLFIGWVIWAATTAGSGQTPAKRLLKLRVIRADSLTPAGMGKMFWMRGLVAGWVAFFAIGCTVGVLAFMPFWDKRRQNIWDKVSSTYVVSDPSDAWHTKPDLRLPAGAL